MALVRVTQGYRFALEPTPAQKRALRSHAGAARFAWIAVLPILRQSGVKTGWADKTATPAKNKATGANFRTVYR